MAKPSRAKTPTDPEGSEGSERRSASMPGAARPEFDPVSAADVFSELSSDRPADPVPPAAPKTDPDLVRDHEIIPAAPVEPGQRAAQHSIRCRRYCGRSTEAARLDPGLAGPCDRQSLRGARHLGRRRHGHRLSLPRSIQRPIRRHQARDPALRQPAGRVRDVVLQGGACARRLGPPEHRASARLRAVARWLTVPGDGARVRRFAARAGAHAPHLPADLDDRRPDLVGAWRTPMRAASSTAI